MVNYYFGDQVGSSRLLTGITGSTCWDADYYPFGGANVLTMSGCQPVYKFAETESDSETSADLNYATFRYYNQRFVRWMSPDPISGVTENPQSWNRYAYVMNRPMIGNDPLGLRDCLDLQGNVIPCTYGPPKNPPDPEPGDPYAGGYNMSSGQCLHPEYGGPGDCPKVPSPYIQDRSDPIKKSLDCKPGSGNCKAQDNGQSKLNQASKAALHTFVFGQVIGTGVGCGTGLLVAGGATMATDTYPLAGATLPAGCVGGGVIGFFEALPFSTLGAMADFGWTYMGH
jgi:RHS repeat-associated protein